MKVKQLNSNPYLKKPPSELDGNETSYIVGSSFRNNAPLTDFQLDAAEYDVRDTFFVDVNWPVYRPKANIGFRFSCVERQNESCC